MTVTEYLIVCDQCRKGATPGKNPGWMSLNCGREPKNYDFCSTACLLNWLEGWEEKVENTP